MKADEVLIRAVTADDLEPLADFRRSHGEPWEDLVESQIRGPPPHRYLAAPPRFDGRMLVGANPEGELLVVGAHHIEPPLEPDVGYVEVIAVALNARGQSVLLPDRSGWLPAPQESGRCGESVRDNGDFVVPGPTLASDQAKRSPLDHVLIAQT